MYAPHDAFEAPARAAADLADYLRARIPLAAAMELEVLEAGASAVRLRAPLPPNRNHRDTAFGGSVASLAILAGWAWLYVRLRELGIGATLVIQRQEVDYLEPVDRDFEAECRAPSAEAWARFERALRSRGRARLSLAARVLAEGRLAADFAGEYVAIVASPA